MMRRVAIPAALLAVGWFCAGCQNPINAHTGRRYFWDGAEEEEAGNLQRARRNFARALANAEMGFLGPANEALCLYNWSRISGYLGMTTEAEKGFLDTIVLIDKAKGKADDLRPNTYWELARFYQDTGEYAKAIPMFSNAVAVIEPRHPEETDPGAFADLLEDYSKSLAKLGRTSEAEAIQLKLAAWRKEHPEPAKYKPRRYNTPAP